MRTVLIAAAGLLISTGLAAAQSQTPRNYDSSGAPQTSGSQQRSGGGCLAALRRVPAEAE
jgi:hypothetical protein